MDTIRQGCDTYYDYAEKFLEIGNCYICTCTQDAFKKLADNKEECPCRNISVDENLNRWKKDV